jgi:hypothetical protein
LDTKLSFVELAPYSIVVTTRIISNFAVVKMEIVIWQLEAGIRVGLVG